MYKTKKVVLNDCYGGFDISAKAANLYNKYKRDLEPTLIIEPKSTVFSPKENIYSIRNLDYVPRDSEALVRVVEELGSEAWCHRDYPLKIYTVKDEPGWDYCIRKYDGRRSSERTSESGKEWIEEHYTPIPVTLLICGAWFGLKMENGKVLEVPMENKADFLKKYSIIDIQFSPRELEDCS